MFEQKIKQLNISKIKNVEKRLETSMSAQKVIDQINEFCKLYNITPKEVAINTYIEYEYGDEYCRARLEARVPKTKEELKKEIDKKQEDLDLYRENELTLLRKLKEKYEKE